jgi:hypothetical protein
MAYHPNMTVATTQAAEVNTYLEDATIGEPELNSYARFLAGAATLGPVSVACVGKSLVIANLTKAGDMAVGVEAGMTVNGSLSVIVGGNKTATCVGTDTWDLT